MPPLEAAPDYGCGLFFSSLIPSRLTPLPPRPVKNGT